MEKCYSLVWCSVCVMQYGANETISNIANEECFCPSCAYAQDYLVFNMNEQLKRNILLHYGASVSACLTPHKSHFLHIIENHPLENLSTVYLNHFSELSTFNAMFKCWKCTHSCNAKKVDKFRFFFVYFFFLPRSLSLFFFDGSKKINSKKQEINKEKQLR